VLEFQAKFEELKFRMLNKNPYLNEEYFVSSFIGGLKDELRLAVQVLQPKTVQEAAEGAVLQEMMFEALLKKQKIQSKGTPVGPITYGNRPSGREMVKFSTNNRYSNPAPVPQNM